MYRGQGNRQSRMGQHFDDQLWCRCRVAKNTNNRCNRIALLVRTHHEDRYDNNSFLKINNECHRQVLTYVCPLQFSVAQKCALPLGIYVCNASHYLRLQYYCHRRLLAHLIMPNTHLLCPTEHPHCVQ